VTEFENIAVEWIGGHKPTAYFRDEQGETVQELALPDLSRDDLLTWFANQGFVAKIPVAEYSSEPQQTGSWNGHTYHYYHTLDTNAGADQFAAARTLDGLGGYIATANSPEEDQFLRELVEDEFVWLAASDEEVDGTWKWFAGPEKGNDIAFLESYPTWQSGEPNNANNVEEEDCVCMNRNGWNDIPCSQRRRVVVEFGGPFPEAARTERDSADERVDLR